MRFDQSEWANSFLKFAMAGKYQVHRNDIVKIFMTTKTVFDPNSDSTECKVYFYVFFARHS